MINKKYITQLPHVITPNLSGFTIYDDGLVTYKIDLNTLSEIVNSKDINIITGGTFSGNTLILNDVNGGLIEIEIDNFDQINSNIISGGTFYGDGSNLTGIQDIRIVRGEYNPVDGSITFYNNLDEEIIVTGFTSDVKYWFTNENRFINYNETMVISDNLILENSNITINNSDTNITIGDDVFYKRGEIFIGGNLVLVDSNIINNGLINVSGSIILNGNSTITGIGIII